MVSFRYHGNYAGPGWSAGKYQSSVAYSNVPAIDEFDETAKEHDREYALGRDRKQADYKFYKRNIGKGVKRTIAALAVGTQGMLRKPKKNRLGFRSSNNSFLEKNKMAAVRKQRKGVKPSQMEVVVKRGRQTQVAKKSKKKKASKMEKRVPESKSGGFFPPGTSKKNELDYFSKSGVVLCAEYGSSIQGSAANKFQSVIVGHATAGLNPVVNMLSFAMTKFLATKMNRDIENFSNIISVAGERGYNFRILWKETPMDVNYSVLPFTFSVVVNTTTWALLQTQLYTWLLNTYSAYPSGILCVLEISRPDVLTTPVVGFERIAQFDLTRAKFEYYAKSSLKIQNRSIGSTGGDEESVDNVPLYGKSYEGTGNYFTAGIVGIGVPTDPVEALSRSYGFLASQTLAEPQGKQQLKRVKKIGKAHIEPGHIVTSVLAYRKKFTLSGMARHLIIAPTGDWEANGLKIGNFRYLHLEKMIQSVATTDVNAIKVHYETDLKQGGIFTCPKVSVTPMVINLNPQ